MKDDTRALISSFLLDIFKQMLDLKHYWRNNHWLPKTLSTRQNFLGQKPDISHLLDSHFLHVSFFKNRQ